MLNISTYSLINKTITAFIFSLLLFGIASCSESKKLNTLDSNARILAFGDSLTYGTGTSPDKSYPSVLQNIIKRKVINAGIPGEISKNGLVRLPQLIAQHQPDLIIIWHGANDILRKMDINRTQENIQQMIEIAANNEIQVILIGVPEFGIFLSPSPIYKVLADTNNLPIENNILSDILTKNAYKSDYIHPNSEGYQLIAERIAKLLKNSGAL